MSRVTIFAIATLTAIGCSRDSQTRQSQVSHVATSITSPEPTAKLAIPGDSIPASATATTTLQIPDAGVSSQPSVEETLVGRFRGGSRATRVLFLDTKDIVHSWTEDGIERREVVTTGYPLGARECKVLRSFGRQDFLLCMYWFTGPGGGRVDGVLFDLKRRILGEFFSAAMNIQLQNTLCYPDTMVGPMPSYTMDGWETKDGTESTDAEVRVTVSKEGWTTEEAAILRTQPDTRSFCRCVGEDRCQGEPKAPTKRTTIVFALTKDQLHPMSDSKATLGEIASQWGHSSFLSRWNLKMRGF